jgi:hypothetical protein
MERLASSAAAGPSGAPSCCSGGGGGGAVSAERRIPRPVFGPMEDSREALEELRRVFDPQRLLEQTELLEPPPLGYTGEPGGGSGWRPTLRQGASILFTAAPEGAVLVQGALLGGVRGRGGAGRRPSASGWRGRGAAPQQPDPACRPS